MNGRVYGLAEGDYVVFHETYSGDKDIDPVSVGTFAVVNHITEGFVELDVINLGAASQDDWHRGTETVCFYEKRDEPIERQLNRHILRISAGDVRDMVREYKSAAQYSSNPNYGIF